MAEEVIPVIWNKKALINLDNIFEYIAKQSPQGVTIVAEAIEEKTKKLQSFLKCMDWID